jgi:hypothetical protein
LFVDRFEPKSPPSIAMLILDPLTAFRWIRLPVSWK